MGKKEEEDEAAGKSGLKRPPWKESICLVNAVGACGAVTGRVRGGREAVMELSGSCVRLPWEASGVVLELCWGFEAFSLAVAGLYRWRLFGAM